MKIRVDTVHSLTKEPISLDIEVGDDIKDAIQRYGDDSVFNRYILGVRYSVISRIRNLTRRKTPRVSVEEAIAYMSKWTPLTPDLNKNKAAHAQINELAGDADELLRLNERAQSILGTLRQQS